MKMKALKFVLKLSPFLAVILFIWYSLTHACGGRIDLSIARATDIIANMRVMKGAALMWYVDKVNSSDGQVSVPKASDILHYFNSNDQPPVADSIEQAKEGNYIITSMNDGREWYVGYKFKNNKEDAEIKPKFAGRAGSLGMLQFQGDRIISYDNAPEVYIRIR